MSFFKYSTPVNPAVEFGIRDDKEGKEELRRPTNR